MRKILSLVLVLSMVLGSFSFAFAAPADVEGTDYEDAVTRLSALEILAGFPDGTFRPSETVTRAQFAKIMANALGVGTAAQYATGATKFADVPADHWAAGYINVVSDMKIVNGYGDGNFGPENQVTYAEAVTMIVRALGYEPKAKAIGGFPGGYIAVAAEEDITEDINIVNTLAATRGDVALMVDASLDVNLMYQKTWGQYPEYSNDDDSKTLLKTKLGVDEIEGLVVDIPNTKSALDAKEIEVKRDSDGKVKRYEVLVEDVNFDSLLGLEVTLWADGSDVVNLDIDTETDNIFFDTVAAKSTKEKVKLYVEDDEFDWASGAELYVNFDEKKLDEAPLNAYGYFVMNDEDEVTFAHLFDFDEVRNGVIFKVDGDKYKYVDNSANDNDTLELSKYKDGVFIYNTKMELIDTDALDVNSAIYAWETSDELYLIVKNETVSGELDKVKVDEVKVAGEEYDRAKDGAAYSDDKFDTFKMYSSVASLDNLNGETVTAVLDINGEVALIYGDSEATSSTMYGVVTYTNMGAKATATVFNKEGKEVDYVFEKRSDANKLEGLKYFKTDVTSLSFGVMEFKLNKDGEIDTDDLTVTALDYSQPSLMNSELHKEADKSYFYVDLNDAGSNKDEKYYISKDTVFVTALNSKGELDPKVLKYETVYENKFDLVGNTEVFIFGTDNKDADMVVFLDKAFDGNDDEIYFGVVTETPGKNKDGDYEAEIDVMGKGVDNYILEDKDDFVNGSLVAFTMNTDGEAEIDTTGNNVTISSNSGAAFDENDDDYLVISNVTKKIGDNVRVWLLTSSGKADEATSISRVDEYNKVNYILDDDSGAIAAITLQDKKDSTSTPDGDEGEITIVKSTAKAGDKVAKVILDSDDTNLYTIHAIDKDGAAKTGVNGLSFFGTREFATNNTVTGALSLSIPDNYDGDILLRLVSKDGKELDAEKVTIDNSKPTFTATYPKADTATANGFSVKVNPSEAGTAYYVVVAQGDTTPTVAEVKAAVDYTGGTVLASGNNAVAKDTEYVFSVSGLSADKNYDVYVMLEDTAGNQIAAVGSASVKTVDTVLPEAGSVSVDMTQTVATKLDKDDTVTLVFSEDIKTISSLSNLNLGANGAGNVPSFGVDAALDRVDAKTYKVTLGSGADLLKDNTITVDVEDIDGNQATAVFTITDTLVVDNTAPTMLSITVDTNTKITITFSEVVTTSEGNPGDFTVTEGSNTYNVTAQADGTADDDKIVLTVEDMTASEDKTITVKYTNNNNEVADKYSNNLESDSTGVSATMNVTP